MAGVTRFEDLVAWQKGRTLAASIYRLTARPPFTRDFAMKNQLRKAALSVPSNIAEGFERYRPAEFHQFLSIAKASCAEIRSQLYVAFDTEYIDEHTLTTLLTQAQNTGNTIGKLRSAVEHRLRSTQHPAPSTRTKR